MYPAHDRNFSRMSLYGNRAQAATAQESSSSSDATATPPDSPRRPSRFGPHSALAQLKALGPRLTPAQRESIAILEHHEEMRATSRTNQDLFRFIDHDSVTESEEVALKRRPSFLLVSPILEDMAKNSPSSQEDFLKVPTIEERLLLTAQTSAIHTQVRLQNEVALQDVRSGTRLRPLTLDVERFTRFIGAHKAELSATIEACSGPARQRNRRVAAIFTSLAHDYLGSLGKRPTGMSAPCTSDDGEVEFDNAPIKVKLIPGRGMHITRFVVDDREAACAVLLKTDNIDDYADDATSLEHCEFGLNEEFAQCNLGERTAVMLLQHLFAELAHVEQKIDVIMTMNHLSSADPGAAKVTEGHIMYDGATEIGDRCDDTIDEFAADEDRTPTQREQISAPLIVMRFHEKLQADQHGAPLMVDPTLTAWTTGLDFDADVCSLIYPDRRLEFAQLESVGNVLRDSGVFLTLPARR